jgi:hypothetical protein
VFHVRVRRCRLRMFFAEADIFGEPSGHERVYLSEHTSHIHRRPSNELSDVIKNPIQSTRTDTRRQSLRRATVEYR